MNISFQKTQNEFVQLEKFVTRRLWKPKTEKQFQAGSYHTALTNLPYAPDSRRLGRLRALRNAYSEPLGEITLSELRAEGNKWKNEQEFFLEFVKDIERDLPNLEVSVARFIPISLYNAELKREVKVRQSASYISKLIYLLNSYDDYMNAPHRNIFKMLLELYNERRKEGFPEQEILSEKVWLGNSKTGQPENAFWLKWFFDVQKKYFGVDDWLLYAGLNSAEMPELLEKYRK